MRAEQNNVWESIKDIRFNMETKFSELKKEIEDESDELEATFTKRLNQSLKELQ